MSELIEKESTSSVFFSVVGAWLGLGGGLLFMALSLVAVVGVVYIDGDSSTLSSKLRDSLGADLASHRGYQLDEKGHQLVINRYGQGGKLTPVLYTVVDDVVVREAGEQRKVLGKGHRFRFYDKKDSLVAIWVEHHAKMRQTWGLHRWGFK